MNKLTILANEYKKTKNEKVFEELYRLSHKAIRSVLSKYIGKNDIDDIVNETYMLVHKHIDLYNDKWSFYTWIKKISYNVYLDFLKKKRKYVNLSELPEYFDVSDGTDLDSFIIKKEIKNIISNLDKIILKLNLKDEDKNILYDRYICKMKYKDLAKKYNLNLNTLKSKIRNGRLKLKKYIITKYDL